jgi:hypothetical protein
VTGGSAEAISLSWLRELAINDQVALMRYPHRTISGEVAAHIAAILGLRRGNAAARGLGPLEAVRTGSKPAKPCPREARQMVEFELADN